MPTSFKLSLLSRFENLRKRAVKLLKNSTIGPSVNIGSSVFIIGPSHPWGELSPDTKHLQTEIYRDYQHLTEITKMLLSTHCQNSKKSSTRKSNQFLG